MGREVAGWQAGREGIEEVEDEEGYDVIGEKGTAGKGMASVRVRAGDGTVVVDRWTGVGDRSTYQLYHIACGYSVLTIHRAHPLRSTLYTCIVFHVHLVWCIILLYVIHLDVLA